MNKKDNNKNNEKKDKKLLIVIAILIVVFIGLIGATFYLNSNKQKNDEKTLAYTELIKELSYGNIEKVEMRTGSTTIKVKQTK